MRGAIRGHQGEEHLMREAIRGLQGELARRGEPAVCSWRTSRAAGE